MNVFLLTWKIKALVLVCVPEENWELNDTFEGSNDAFYTKMSPALYSHPHLP